MTPAVSHAPVLPDYGGACVSNIVPALLAHRDIGDGWIPDAVFEARQVVLLVLDGLGSRQLDERWHHAPTLRSMGRSEITTVAPTTTSTALTSIATGTTPGEHGLVGYKVRVGGEVVNMLRWSSGSGDASDRIDPLDVQPVEPFLGRAPSVVSPREFRDSPFSVAHLRGGTYVGYSLPSSVAVEVRSALDRGDAFVYAYYDGIDKIAHITGLFEHYDAELAAVDRLVRAVIDALPPGVALVVTADHGQVQVGERIEMFDASVMAATACVSGEARFAWLHAHAGRSVELLDAASTAHGHHAWVLPVQQVIDERWLGHTVSGPARSRLGDVAVVAREPIAIVDPEAKTPALQSRHGSMTADEVLVPLLSVVT